MNVPQQLAALEAQKHENWIDDSLLRTIYGLRLGSPFESDFRRWSRLLRRPLDVIKGDHVNRFALEYYFQKQKLLPSKWAAARLGMTQDSLEDALQAAARDRISTTFRTGDDLLPQDLDQIWIQILPPLQSTIFSSHNSFCRKLHEAIAIELGVSVAPEHCVTSAALGEQQMDAGDGPDYSYSYCILSDQPIGIRYRIWLDLGKPINLAPDFCSYVTYFQNELLISPKLLQEAPERPAGI